MELFIELSVQLSFSEAPLLRFEHEVVPDFVDGESPMGGRQTLTDRRLHRTRRLTDQSFAALDQCHNSDELLLWQSLQYVFAGFEFCDSIMKNTIEEKCELQLKRQL